tara:strand:+ start:53 stop:265 length:213 start_codon:yes stop_codon:yes gene_type:complete
VVKFLLLIQICSALDGSCLPQQAVNVSDSWYQCAREGTKETIALMDSIGEPLINRNRLYITFTCQVSNET